MSLNTINSSEISRAPNCLSITQEQFDDLYPDLRGLYDFYNEPIPSDMSTSDIEELYFPSKLWRLNNLYTIINKKGEPAIFKMNYAQHVVYARSRLHPRLIILKSRQQGISTLWLVSYFDDSVWCPFLNVGLMAQGTDEASTLLERVKFLWDTLDQDIKSFVNVSLEKDNTKEYALSNKSTIFIRVSFRSATLQRLHVSEYGKIANQYPKRAKEVKTGTLQALAVGNTGVIESTAEGKNDFQKMWNGSVIALKSGQMTEKDFYPVFLSWVNDPDCVQEVDQTINKEAEEYFAEVEKLLGITLSRQQKNFWITQERELEGDVYQEYPATPEEAFTASRDGTYYAKRFMRHVVQKNRMRANVYDPNLPVDVYFDLGVDDYAVLIGVQWYRGEWRIIFEYFNDGYGLSHYIDWLFESKYRVAIRALRFPHDIEVREQGNTHSSGLAKTRYDAVAEYIKEIEKREGDLEWRLDVLPKGSVADGIESVRRLIPKLVLDTSCVYVKDCFVNYSKEWDDKLQQWKKTPLHDEYSHGADTLRQIAANTIEVDTQHTSKLGRQERLSSVPGGVSL